MTRLNLVVIMASLSIAQALGAPSINDLSRAHLLCESHKNASPMPSQRYQKPYADGWDNCLDIEVEYQKQMSAKNDRDESTNPDLRFLNDTARAIGH